MKRLNQSAGRFWAGLAWACVLFASSASVHATVYYVETNGTDGASGTSWATAWKTIRYASTNTVDNDLVWVSNGVYTISSEIRITNGITVRGLNGAANTRVQRAAVGSADPKHRIFSLDHANAVLDGLTASNGYLRALAPTNYGAGIYVAAGTLRNCAIRENQLYGENPNFARGSGVYLVDGLVTNCDIVWNSAVNHVVDGAIYMEGGLVTDCLIANNSSTYRGGGLYAAGGLAQHCTIVSNDLWYYGGGVCLENAELRNCLVAYNAGRWGGGVYGNPAVIDSCTITRNNASTHRGGFNGNGQIVNTIIYHNTAPVDPNYNGGTYTYSCLTPGTAGAGIVTGDPQFVDLAGGDFHLLPGSPCLDAGTSNAWMGTGVDLDGNARILVGTNDMGIYEFKAGPLLCNFEGNVLEGIEPLDVVFASYVSGTNQQNLFYRWSFTNAAVVDQQGTDKAIVTNTYAAGTHTVTLMASNAVGETSTRTRTGYISVGPATVYVSKTGTPQFPYTSWATAATNIQGAVNAAVNGTLVLVDDGRYSLTNEIYIDKAITVRSINGHASTIVDAENRTDTRCFYVDNVDAVIDGFTIMRGDASTYNSPPAPDYHEGGGVYLYYDGTVQNCNIVSNECRSYGGGVYCTGGGTVRNCLVRGNTSRVLYGGGVYVSVGASVLVENCTIVQNSANNRGGGMYLRDGTLRNSIVEFNTAPTDTNLYYSSGTVEYSCLTPDPGGTRNITNDPMFVDMVGGDYGLRGISPCVDAGLDQAWMNTALGLGGNPRITRTAVDMGAYEAPPAGALFMIR